MLVTLGQGFPVIEAAELNFDLVSTNSWEPLIHSLQNEATISRGVTINWNIEKLYRECLWYAYRIITGAWIDTNDTCSGG